MRDVVLDSPLLLCALVVLFGALASLFPVSPVEPVLVGVGAVAPPWLLMPLVVLATASHMATKTLVFLGGSRVERAFNPRNRARVERIRVRLSGSQRLQQSTLFLSSVSGLPPFYLTTALCGTLRMPLRQFLMVATTGRAIRFAILIFVPQLLWAQPAPDSYVPPSPVTTTGAGNDTYVLLSGMVGGTAGYRRISTLLEAQGKRVIAVDTYQLSIDSTDLSFHALARRVDRELGALGVADATVVGHAHGGGVALRLAANAPHRVRALVLLDVGALAANRSTVFSSTIRLVPIITRLPRGKSFVRSRFLAGIRANSGRTEWLDDSTIRAYTEPMLTNIGRVIAMALRLADAAEPEPLASVVARIRMPVTVLLAELKRSASPGAEEFVALAPLGSLVRIDTIVGAGHFVHEESPHDVVARLTRSRQAIASVTTRGAQ